MKTKNLDKQINKYSELAKLLNRTNHSILKHYQHLKKKLKIRN